MSGIFGTYSHGGGPVCDTVLAKMADSIAHRGPDGTSIVRLRHIGMGHSMLQTTPESLQEILPVTDPESKLTITADARIDNREELLNQLGIVAGRDLPDSSLILYAYKKWGTESFIRLVGDFAFAIWDPRRQLLTCARDYIGVKPFYYHHSPDHFLFSSEIMQIAENPDIPLQPNEEMVGENLSFSFRSQTETLFENIYRLAPGHFLKVSPGKLVIKKFWTLQHSKRIWYKNNVDYSEHFLEIFHTAVKSRLRTIGPISAELSGGLDSSTVVAMASKILGLQNRHPPETYAMVFPGLRFNEQNYIDSVSAKLGLPVQCIDSQHYRQPDWTAQVTNSYEPPDMPNLSIRAPLIEKITDSSSRIVLSGIGGDEWFTGSGYPYLDLIKGGKFKDLKKELYHSFRRNKSFTLKRILLEMGWPVTPKFIRRAFCKTAPSSLPPWIPDTFITKTDLRKRLQESDPRIQLSKLSNLLPFSILNTGGEVFFLETMDRYHSRNNIEYRSPFLDRRLAEFAVAIPEYQRQKCSEIKVLLRNPSIPLLPETVRRRTDKAEFSYFFGRAFKQRQFVNAMEKATISQQGWLDQQLFQEKFRERLSNFEENIYHSGSFNWEFWFGFAIETWYKTVFSR